MNKFEKTVLYGAAFAIGGFLATLLLVWLVDVKPIAGTSLANRIRVATGKGA